MEKKANHFSGQLGFVLAAAGSAVGVGNLWHFPYLAAMGKAGVVVGALFFVTAIFATLTSCISVLESITANCVEIFHWERKKAVRILSVIYLAASAVIALGYSVFYFEVQLPNGSAAQLLDIMDYVSNSVMIRYIAPVMMLILFLQSTGILS